MNRRRTGRANEAVTWRQFARRGYSAFASLKREIRIGVLSVATLGIAAQAQASLSTSTSLIGRGDEGDGDEKELEEVTVSGTMAPLTELQAARIVGVISRREIEQAGAQCISDLLKLAAGVDVRQRGGFGIQTDISIDGGTPDQMTLLLNGVNISNPHTGHLAADLPVCIDDIERIEVLEGAASRVYGATAFGGAVNIVTRSGGDDSMPVRGRKMTGSAEATARGGSFGTAEAWGRGALSIGHLTNSLSGGGGRSDGGTANSDWRKGQLYWQGSYRADGLSLRWQAGMTRKAYGANTFYSAAYPDQYERNERWLTSVEAETGRRLKLAPTAYWTRTLDNFKLVRGERFGENFHRADVYGLRIGSHFSWAWGRTALAAELRHEGILSTNLGRDLDASEYISVRGEDSIQYTRSDGRTTVSYSAEHNIVLRRWTVSGGLTVCPTGNNGGRYQLFPGIDVAWRPAEGWKLSASYNKGFRLPTFTELYYKSPTHEGDLGLKAEVNHSVQAGVQYRIGGIETMLRLFCHCGRDMMDWVMYHAGDTYHATSFDLDNAGLQVSARMDGTLFWGEEAWLRDIAVGYTYIHQWRHDDATVWKSNSALDYLRHKLTARLTHRVWSRLEATWSLRWQDRMGSYELYEGTYTDQATGRLRGRDTGLLAPYGPYTTLDVNLRWTAPRYELFIQGTNLTNRHYYDLGNVPQPGICILAGAKLKLGFQH